ncbi:MAG: hypothetical protein O4859_11025 [Trichodesmium sp. St18_bin1]|nr:hypothetical protein [Trichodesmium sp. St18_bin1]
MIVPHGAEINGEDFTKGHSSANTHLRWVFVSYHLEFIIPNLEEFFLKGAIQLICRLNAQKLFKSNQKVPV